MSITDELREFIDGHLYLGATVLGGWKEVALAIADRIDAEHERAVCDARHDALYGANESDMADLGWVRLPKDVDGEYIHIGDVMVYADDNTCPLPVTALVPPALFLTYDGPRYADMCRHAPTVEDVLREFAVEVCGEPALTIRSGVVEEYAAKLRLAGES